MLDYYSDAIHSFTHSLTHFTCSAVGLYMIEIWKAIGMDMTNVRFLWASEEINAHADEYWTLVM